MTTFRFTSMIAAALLTCATTSHSQAATFDNLYAFGDSLSDCCWIGRFTQGDTPTWVDQLPALIGADHDATAENNLAVGGAQSGLTSASPALDQSLGVLTGFLSQVARFTSSAVTVGPNDIATIWVGTNDIHPSVLDDQSAYQGVELNRPLGTKPSVTALVDYIAGNIANGIQQLRDNGIRNIALVGPYDISNVGFITQAEDRELASDYSRALNARLSTLFTEGVDTYYLDMIDLLDEVQANPAAYGFDFTTGFENCDAAAIDFFGDAGKSCIDLPDLEQARFVFSDAIHVTSGFGTVMAEELAGVINSGQTITAPVPVPASVLLLLSGVAGLGALRGRRKTA